MKAVNAKNQFVFNGFHDTTVGSGSGGTLDDKMDSYGDQLSDFANLKDMGDAGSRSTALAATINLTFAVPSNFSDKEKSNVNLNNIVVAVQISSAAVMTPVEGSPALGVPADWTTPHKYAVKAANGETKVWTITCTLTK